MRKRFLGLLIVLAFALPFVTAAPCFANTGETTIGQINYQYDMETNEAAAVRSELGISGNVAIPETIEVDGQKYKVTSIRDFAFMGRFSLTGIIIPEGVTSIGDSAFASCFNMTQIAIPNSVTSIGTHAFQDCRKLTQITIPESVTSIGESAFEYCTGLTKVTIPEGVTSIGNAAFSNCISLSEVIIPEGVTSIGDFAFYDCAGLEEVTIPESVTFIGGAAFRGCSKLTQITIPNRVTSIESGTFYDCGSLSEVTIPEGVTSIRNYAFQGCSKLTQIIIPNSVISIGTHAFQNCVSLTNVYAKEGLSLGNAPFEGASQDIHIWRYEMLKSTGDATHVKIVSAEDQGGSSIPNSFDIQCSAMGDDYVIDEVEPDNLSLKHALIKTEETPATCENPGNKECWTCTVCGKYFKDEGGTEPISSEDIEIPATGHSYENGKCAVCGAIDPDFKAVITTGANGTWQKGTKDGLSFTSNAAFADFQKVSVDGKDLDASSYTVEEGSTIVTLQPSYLDTLSVGKHTLAIVSDTGTAETEFTVAAAGQAVSEGQAADNEAVNSGDKDSLAKTGDVSMLPIAALSILAVASIAVGALALRRSRI